MKLLFIYGPPAAGKLTVANEVAKKTGYRVFHNHVTIDLARTLFDFGTPQFWRLVDKYRKELVEEAAKEKVNTIFTFVYAKGSDDKFVKEIIRRVEGHKGKVCFVQLRCSKVELARRVGNASRKEHRKLTTKVGLAKLLERFEVFSPIPFVESLSLDTTHNSSRKIAREIIRHYKL